MRFIIIDLEATCWESGEHSRDDMETIEFGAVALANVEGAFQVESEFGAFVRPVVHSLLSDFCLRLTSIRQMDVDAAETFPAVLHRLLAWIGEAPFTLCSWGDYDLNQLRRDCQRHGIPSPPDFERHINLKREFARVSRVKPRGMARALEHAGLPLQGTHHRGADDARNIARLAMLVLPRLDVARTSYHA